MLKCNGATHSVSLPKKHSITSLEEDEESMVFVNRDAGPSGSKQSGDFDYPAWLWLMATAFGWITIIRSYTAAWRIRWGWSLRRSARGLAKSIYANRARTRPIRGVSIRRLCSAPSTEGAGCLCGSEEKRLAVISKLLISSISILSLFWENSK